MGRNQASTRHVRHVEKGQMLVSTREPRVEALSQVGHLSECLADGLGENTFCETVVSESALLGWTEAEDHEHDTVVECALTSTAPLASHSAALSRALPILTTQHSSLRPPVTPQRRGHQ